MTGTRKKANAVLFAAIMVVSMVAAGFAAAPAAALSDNSPGSDGVTAGTNTTGVVTTHTFNTTVDSGDAILSGNGGNDDIASITVDYSGFGTPGTPYDTVIDEQNVTVSINGVEQTLAAGQSFSGPSATINLDSAASVADGDTVNVSIENVTNPESAESGAVDFTVSDSQSTAATASASLGLTTTQPNIDVEPEQQVVDLGTSADFTVTVTDSNGNGIEGADLVNSTIPTGVEVNGGTTAPASNDTNADGEATFTVVNVTGESPTSYDLDFTEQLSATGNSTTGTYITVDESRGVLTGNIRDLNGNVPSNVGDTEITIVGTDGSSNEIYNETFQAGDSGANDEYTRSVPTQGSNTQYTVSANLSGFDDFSGTPTVTPGETTTQDIRLERVITPDEINIVNVDPSDTVDVENSIDVTVNVTSADFAGSSAQQPLENTPVEAGVNSETLPSGADDIFIGADGTNKTIDTNADGEATFTISVDSTDYESIEEVVETQIRFVATDGNNVNTTQDLSFEGEARSGDGTISGDVDLISDDVSVGVQSENADAADGVTVHAVGMDRITPNTQTIGSGTGTVPNGDEYIRVVNDSTGAVLDVQTDYLVTQSSPVEVTSNTSLPGTGFDVTSDGTGSYSVHALESGTYRVQSSGNGSFDAPSNITTFTATNDLRYSDIQDRYSDVPAQQTDVTGADGEFFLTNLYTNGATGQDYAVIAGDGNGNLGFANGYGYDTSVTVEQNVAPGQTDVALAVQQIDVDADSVDIENIGTLSDASDADGNYSDVLDEFDNTSDEFRQPIPRDGSTVDAIDVTTFLEEGGSELGANVTLTWTNTTGNFDGAFLNTAVNGEITAHSDDQITVNTEDGNAVVFLQTDRAGLGTDSNVTINAAMDNAEGTDSTDKQFNGVLAQEYASADITGVVSDDNDNPVDATVYVNEIADEDADVRVTFEPDDESALENFTATVFDSNGDVVETVNLTDADMRNFEFQGFDSDLTLDENTSSFELLADRASDRSTLSPVPAVENDPGVSISLTGVSQTGETGSSVSTAVEVDRTSTASIVIEGAAAADFRVDNLDPEDANVSADAVFNVSADITNDGDLTGTQDIELQLDGTTVDTQSVTLDAGDSTPVVFEVDASDLDAGDYEHAIVSDDDDATGTLTVQEANNGSAAPQLSDYQNEDGDVEVDGLRMAIDDFSNGEIEVQLLRDVIDAFSG